jgi:hypothetical protein
MRRGDANIFLPVLPSCFSSELKNSSGVTPGEGKVQSLFAGSQIEILRSAVGGRRFEVTLL